jgi:hypothetical protein
MPKKTKQFTEREKAVYAAGYRNGLYDGENRLQRTINVLLAAHNDMAEEMLRLDLEQPVTGDPRNITITLRVTTFKKIIRALGKESTLNKRRFHKGTLQKLLDKHEAEQQAIAENIEKGLRIK